MTEGAIQTYSKGGTRLGWLVAIFYVIQSYISTNMPRVDKILPLREYYRGWHYLVGIILLLLVLWRLSHWWRQDRNVTPPPGLSAPAFRWARLIALTTYIILLAAPFFGMAFAWSDGLSVHLGSWLTLPSLIAKNYSIWMFSGYFHSGLSFIILVLNIAALVTATYTLLRYGRGLIAAFPPGFGAQVLLSMAITVYALTTFRSPEPGPRAVAIFLLIVAVVAAIGWLIGRNRIERNHDNQVPMIARWLSLASILALVGVGGYGPHALFRVTPWPMGEVIPGLPGVTSHAAPVARVSAWKETAFEHETAAQTYKWCGFCHTFKKGEQTKAGPNLYAIFGQRASSVPNFHYSSALAAKRDGGLIWTDETLDAFLANPDKNVPGTSMVISSGPVTDPKVRRAVINMLKRDTMAGAIDVVPAPAGQ